ncbi:HEAT repeat domain-containing protein [Tomitella fengzijianii]|uniref:HEAT repeat domain-containing protein n=1 Tax=Tomitella fengzijianii TaxID=2597660 RepID=A0A516X1W7_9ACTN|nr:HEAT repeat domain-containing protein [Tomitella fengzijianii]QDQ97007.1 HEAT repeat domain-containing protein [Tomitella fengzijianii]
MTPRNNIDAGRRTADALAHPNPSVRLRAAMAAGSRPDASLAQTLVFRCAVEPDFYVRDMLTWALTRVPSAVTVPLLLDALGSDATQARSQALHTLSKIGDAAAWPAVAEHLGAEDDEVARAAWRASVSLVPAGAEETLATRLSAELGRGGAEMRRSLSRALAALGEYGAEATEAAGRSGDEAVRLHVRDTLALMADPDAAADAQVHAARRLRALGPQAAQGD